MSKLPKHLIFSAIIIFVALKMSLPLITTGLYIQWQLWIPVALWLLGSKIGFIILELDRLVDIYLVRPDTQLAYHVKQLFAQKRYRQGWSLIIQNKSLQPNLTFRSAVFQVIWVFLAIFAFTSTESFFGKGFIIGLGLKLLLDQWQDYLTNKTFLKQWLFWQVNRHFTDKELTIYLSFITAITFWLLLII